MKLTRAILPLILILLLVGGCAAGQSASHSAPMEMSASSAADEIAMDDGDYYEYYGEAPAMDLAAGMGEDGEAVRLTDGRKIVYSANFEIRTKEFDRDIDGIRAQVAQMGGYFEIDSVDSYGGADSPRYGRLHMRVPQAQFGGMMEFLRSIGEVAHQSSNASDVTQTYVDYEIRIDVLKQNLERLQQLQEQTEDIDSIILLQQEMNQTLLELEYLTGDLRRLDNQIDYATIDVSLEEVLADQLQAGEDDLLGRMQSGFVRSTNGIFSFARGLLVFGSYMLPVLMLLGALFLAFCVVFRLIAKRWPFAKKQKAADRNDERP